MNFNDKVYAVVRCVPRGRVTSYGRIASMLGVPNGGRAVGYALRALDQAGPDYRDVPWQRVVNSQGRIVVHNRSTGPEDQAALLRAEGIPIGRDLRVDMERYLWSGLSLDQIEAIVGRR